MTNTPTHNRERSCIACGAKASKADLLRIVRTAEGISFDASGKLAGRGAYVCSPECFDKARTGRLSHALKTKVSNEEAQVVAQALQAHIQRA
ncbi:MAG: YlxR family protein [Eggerthellaceae bacterium]|nr:YlxR family protein [Eggerthellaceae bacterium]